MTPVDISRRRTRALRGLASSCLAAAALAACGGGGTNPLGNPPLVDNPAGTTGQKLSFIYFQKCINPIFLAQLQINQGGVISTNTCTPAANYLLQRPSTVPHPSGATGQAGAVLPVGSANYNAIFNWIASGGC